jgi:signal transduction histidine kinase
VNLTHRFAARTEAVSALATALILGGLTAADTAVTAAGPASWPGELAVAALTGLLALLRRPGPPAGRLSLGQLRAAAAGLAVCLAAGILSDLARLPTQPGMAATAGLLVLGAAAVRVATRRAAGLVAVAGAVTLTAGRAGLRGEYAVSFSLLGLFAWCCALAVGGWLRLLDTRRRLAIDAARRDERLGLARDLHDVVAHHVAGIVVQAQAAQIAAARRPEGLGETLAGIEAAGNDALAAMRRVVGLLRDDRDDTEDRDAPGPAQLADLVRRFAGHGPEVQFTLPDPAGTGPPWPPGVAAAVYRVVQEALTNVALHAPGAGLVTVTVAEAGPGLTVEVSDDAPRRELSGASERAGGNGLTGMRERVAALGGTLSAGPGQAGGWVVTASLPLRAATGRAAVSRS